MLGSAGQTQPSLRGALLEHTRTGRGAVPEALREFVEKIAGQPWAITDEDFTCLGAAGYSEDQIYEIVLASAVGAGLRRFDAGLRALDSARDDPAAAKPTEEQR